MGESHFERSTAVQPQGDGRYRANIGAEWMQNPVNATRFRDAGINLFIGLWNGPTEEQLTAEGDKSPGVLLSSGYIAGGAIAGIVIAFMAGVLGDTQNKIDDWAKHNNPVFEGPWSDSLSLIPFVAIATLLYFIAVKKKNGAEAAPKRACSSPPEAHRPSRCLLDANFDI